MNKIFLSAALSASFLAAPIALTAPAHAVEPNPRAAVELVAPDYPRGAERRGVEGTVTVRYSVAADGSVLEAEVVEADPAGVFDRAALSAVREWRFEPAAAATEGHTRDLDFRLGQ